jgi:hypothetical protein
LSPGEAPPSGFPKEILREWIVDALEAHGGSADLIQVCRHIWRHHEDDLWDSGDLFYTWQYDVRWAASDLRGSGVMRDQADSPRGVWELAGPNPRDDSGEETPAADDRLYRYCAAEADEIRELLDRRLGATGSEQRVLRRRLRNLGFHISDWRDVSHGSFTGAKFDSLVQKGLITVTGSGSGEATMDGGDWKPWLHPDFREPSSHLQGWWRRSDTGEVVAVLSVESGERPLASVAKYNFEDDARGSGFRLLVSSLERDYERLPDDFDPRVGTSA